MISYDISSFYFICGGGGGFCCNSYTRETAMTYFPICVFHTSPGMPSTRRKVIDDSTIFLFFISFHTFIALKYPLAAIVGYKNLFSLDILLRVIIVGEFID